MALLRLDIKRMEINVEVGILEEYKPDREIRRIFKNFESLKEESKLKLQKLTDSETSEAAGKVLAEDLELQKEWKDYLIGDFNSKLKSIIGSVNSKNEKICPGYKKHTN